MTLHGYNTVGSACADARTYARTLAGVDKLSVATADADGHTLDLLAPPPAPALRLEVRSQQTSFRADVLALFQLSAVS